MADTGMRGWQPIETAPRDGTEIILGCWKPTHSAWLWVEDSWWVDDGWNLTAGREILEGEGHRPTHWMPLPNPSETENG